MMAFIPSDPAKMAGIRTVVSVVSSNETSTSTWRHAPLNIYLLFEDQPAIIIDSAQIAPAAMIYSAPIFKSTPRMVGARGTTAHKITTDIIESNGARL